jgi:hypothetical protein
LTPGIRWQILNRMHDPHDPDDPADAFDGEREGWVGFVPEFVKKVAVAGLGALFMTEEGIRSLAGQLKLPKEVLTFILSQADKTKAEVGRVVSEELRRFLQSEKLREEVLKLLSGMTVEIKAQVRLVPDAERQGSGQAPTEGGSPRLVVSELGARRSRRGKKD